MLGGILNVRDEVGVFSIRERAVQNPGIYYGGLITS